MTQSSAAHPFLHVVSLIACVAVALVTPLSDDRSMRAATAAALAVTSAGFSWCARPVGLFAFIVPAALFVLGSFMVYSAFVNASWSHNVTAAEWIGSALVPVLGLLLLIPAIQRTRKAAHQKGAVA